MFVRPSILDQPMNCAMLKMYLCTPYMFRASMLGIVSFAEAAACTVVARLDSYQLFAKCNTNKVTLP